MATNLEKLCGSCVFEKCAVSPASPALRDNSASPSQGEGGEHFTLDSMVNEMKKHFATKREASVVFLDYSTVLYICERKGGS